MENTIRMSEVLWYIDIFLILIAITKLIHTCIKDEPGPGELPYTDGEDWGIAIFFGFVAVPVFCYLIYLVYYFITTTNWIW